MIKMTQTYNPKKTSVNKLIEKKRIWTEEIEMEPKKYEK